MENILFDLYVAEIEINENSFIFLNDSARKQQLLNLIFEKHRVTEQKFDTSLIWYNANLEKYVKINENLSKRYDFLLAELKVESERLRAESLRMDTAFLHTSPTFILQSKLKENSYKFNENITNSTNSGNFHVQFLSMGISNFSRPVFTFAIQSQDTTFIHRDTLTQNGWFNKQYVLPENYQAQSIYGNFYLPRQRDNHLFVKDFSIFQLLKKRPHNIHPVGVEQ